MPRHEEPREIAGVAGLLLEKVRTEADGEGCAAPFAEDADFVHIGGAHHDGRTSTAGGHPEIFDSICRGCRVDIEVADDSRQQRRSLPRRAPFATREEWAVVRVPFSALRATAFGEPIGVPPVDLAKVERIGLYILDGIDGPFRLEVDAIRGFRAEPGLPDADGAVNVSRCRSPAAGGGRGGGGCEPPLRRSRTAGTIRGLVRRGRRG